jgi:hypothetical protein
MGNKQTYNPEQYEILIPGQNTYKINKKNVFWRGNKIQADGLSFKDLNGGYGQDYLYLYYRGNRINNKVKNFKYIKDGYGKSNFNVFYKGNIIKADPKSFRIFINGYAKDKNNIYYNGKIYRKRNQLLLNKKYYS